MGNQHSGSGHHASSAPRHSVDDREHRDTHVTVQDRSPSASNASNAAQRRGSQQQQHGSSASLPRSLARRPVASPHSKPPTLHFSETASGVTAATAAPSGRLGSHALSMSSLTTAAAVNRQLASSSPEHQTLRDERQEEEEGEMEAGMMEGNDDCSPHSISRPPSSMRIPNALHTSADEMPSCLTSEAGTLTIPMGSNVAGQHMLNIVPVTSTTTSATTTVTTSAAKPIAGNSNRRASRDGGNADAPPAASSGASAGVKPQSFTHPSHSPTQPTEEPPLPLIVRSSRQTSISAARAVGAEDKSTKSRAQSPSLEARPPTLGARKEDGSRSASKRLKTQKDKGGSNNSAVVDDLDIGTAARPSKHASGVVGALFHRKSDKLLFRKSSSSSSSAAARKDEVKRAAKADKSFSPTRLSSADRGADATDRQTPITAARPVKSEQVNTSAVRVGGRAKCISKDGDATPSVLSDPILDEDDNAAAAAAAREKCGSPFPSAREDDVDEAAGDGDGVGVAVEERDATTPTDEMLLPPPSASTPSSSKAAVTPQGRPRTDRRDGSESHKSEEEHEEGEEDSHSTASTDTNSAPILPPPPTVSFAEAMWGTKAAALIVLNDHHSSKNANGNDSSIEGADSLAGGVAIGASVVFSASGPSSGPISSPIYSPGGFLSRSGRASGGGGGLLCGATTVTDTTARVSPRSPYMSSLPAVTGATLSGDGWSATRTPVSELDVKMTKRRKTASQSAIIAAWNRMGARSGSLAALPATVQPTSIGKANNNGSSSNNNTNSHNSSLGDATAGSGPTAAAAAVVGSAADSTATTAGTVGSVSASKQEGANDINSEAVQFEMSSAHASDSKANGVVAAASSNAHASDAKRNPVVAPVRRRSVLTRYRGHPALFPPPPPPPSKATREEKKDDAEHHSQTPTPLPPPPSSPTATTTAAAELGSHEAATTLAAPSPTFNESAHAPLLEREKARDAVLSGLERDYGTDGGPDVPVPYGTTYTLPTFDTYDEALAKSSAELSGAAAAGVQISPTQFTHANEHRSDVSALAHHEDARHEAGAVQAALPSRVFAIPSVHVEDNAAAKSHNTATTVTASTVVHPRGLSDCVGVVDGSESATSATMRIQPTMEEEAEDLDDANHDHHLHPSYTTQHQSLNSVFPYVNMAPALESEEEGAASSGVYRLVVQQDADATSLRFGRAPSQLSSELLSRQSTAVVEGGGFTTTRTRAASITVATLKPHSFTRHCSLLDLSPLADDTASQRERSSRLQTKQDSCEQQQQQQKQQINTSLGLLWSDSPSPGSSEVAASPLSRHSHQNHFTEPKTLPLDSQEREPHEKEEQEEGEEGDMVGATDRLHCRQREKDGEGMEVVDGEELGLNNSRNSFDAASTPLLLGPLRQPTYAELPSAGSDADNHADHNSNNNDSTSNNASYPRHHLHLVSPPTFVTASRSGSIGSTGPVTAAAAAATAVSGVVQSSSTQPKRALIHQQQQQQQQSQASSFTTSARHMPYWRERLTPVLHAQPSSPRSVSVTRDDLCTASTTSNRHLSHYNNPNGGDESGGYHSSPAGSGLRRRRLSTASQGPPPLARHPSSSSCPPQQLQRELSSSGVQWREVSLLTSAVGTPSVGADIGMSSREEEEEEGLRREGPLQRRGYTRGDGGDDDDEEEEEVRSGKYGSAAHRRAALQRRSRRPHGHRAEDDDGVGAPRRGDEPYDPWGRSMSSPLLWGTESPRLRQRAHVRKNNKNVDEDEEVEEDTPGQMTYYGDKRDSNELHRTAPYHRPHRLPSSQLPYSHISGSEDDAGQHANCGGHGHHHHRFFSPRGVPVLYGASPPQDSSLPCTPPEEISRRTRNARSLFPSGGDGDGDVAAFLPSSVSDLDIPHTRTSTTSFAENASRLPLTRYEPPMPSNRNTFTAFVPLSDIPSSHLLASATAIFRGGYPYGEDSGASSKPIPGAAAAAANDSGEAAVTATTTTIGNGFSMGDTPVTVDTLLVTGYSPAGVSHPVSGLTGCGVGGAAVNDGQLNSPLFSSVSTAPTSRISSGCSPVQGTLSPFAGIAPNHPLHHKHSRSHSRSSSNNNSSSSHPNDHANGGESGGGGAAAAAAAGVAGGEDGQCAPLHGVTPFLRACGGEERPVALPRQPPSTTTARDAAAQLALPLKRKNGPKMAAPAAAAATAAVSQKPMSPTSTLLSSVNCAAAEHLPTTEDATTPQQQQHSPWSVQSAPAGVAEVVARTGFTHLSSWESELHYDMRELVLTPTLAAVSHSNGPSARIEVAPLATSATATTPKSVFASFTSALTSVVGADRSRKSSGFVSSNEGANFNGGVNATSAVGGTLFIERQDTTPLFSGAGSAGSDGGSIHRHASAKVLRSSQSPRPLPSALARTNSEPILSFPPHHSAALYPNQSQELPWWNRPRLARSEDSDFLVEQLAVASPAGGPGRVIGPLRSAPPELQTTGVQQQQEAERKEGNSHYRHRRSNGSSDTNSNHNRDNLGGDAVAGGGVEAVAEPQHAIMPRDASETFFLVRNEDDRLREREHDTSNNPLPLTMARSLNSDEATAHEPKHHDDLHGSDNDEEGRLVDACVQTASWHPCSPHSSSVSHDTRLLSSRTSAGLERTFSQTRDADPKSISTAALAMVVVPPTSSFLDEAHRDVNTPERQGDQQHGKGERESSTAAALAFDASLATLVDAEAFTRACVRESAEEVLETWRSIWAALQQAASVTSPMLLSATLTPLSSYVAGRARLGREEGEEGGRNAQPVTSPSSPTPSHVVTRFASVAHSPTNTAPLLSAPPLRSIMAAAAAAVRNSTDDATATTTVSPTAQGEGEGEEEGDGESEGRGVMAAAASPFRMAAPLGDNEDELSAVEQTAATRESATRQRRLLSPTDADANAAGATAVMTTAEEKSSATSVQEDSVDAASAANADAGRTQNSSTEAVELSPLHGDGTSRNASMTVTATAPHAPPPLPGEHEAPSYFLFGPSTTTGLTQNNTLSLRTDDEEAEGREENENLWSATAPAHNTAAPSRRLSSSDGTSQVAVPVAELQQQQQPETVDGVVNGGARASFVETGVHVGTREQTRGSVALCAKAALPPPTPSPPSSSLQYIALAATSLNTRDGSPDPSPSPPPAFRDDAANPNNSIMNHYTRRGSDAVAAAAAATPTTITTAAGPLILPPSSPPHRNDEADGRRSSNADGVDPARHASPSPRSQSLQASDFSPSQQRTLSAKRRPSVGQVMCRWCNAPYTSAAICPVARRTHQLLREERKKEKMTKRQAQALLCVGRVAEAVTLLKEVGLYVP